MAKSKKRFVETHTEGSMNINKILVDTLTGVNYLFVQQGYGGGLCVMVDAAGKPIVSPLEQYADWE